MLRLLSFLACFVAAAAARAQVPADGSLTAEQRAALSDVVRGILLDSLPERIDVQDDWGDTRQTLSGLTWHFKGLRVDVERRMKDVKHGLWKQAEITPVDPANNLRFSIVEARGTGPQSIAFQVRAASPLHVLARIERWRNGVKMLNFSTEGDADVEIRVAGNVDYRFDTGGDKSAVVFTPHVATVDLTLTNLDWRRVGPISGEVVTDLGDTFQGVVAKQFDRQEPKVTEKLNQAIAKRQDKLRIPLNFVDVQGTWEKLKKFSWGAAAAP